MGGTWAVRAGASLRSGGMTPRGLTRCQVERALSAAGFPGAREEAEMLWSRSGGDAHLLEEWARRRLDGEPLAWLIGQAVFCGSPVVVEPGVYVPRPQSEPLAQRAADLLPAGGLGLDVATGSGAVAVTMSRRRRSARVVATDRDPAACACARSNGVEVYQGHLGEAVPSPMWGCFDVVVGIVPYVPADELQFLPGDVLRHEPLSALDGGKGGLDLLVPLVRSGRWLLGDNGSMVIELGGEQDRALSPVVADAGLEVSQRFVDSEGDLRGLELRRAIAGP